MWIARDLTSNALCLYNSKPVRDDLHGCWSSNIDNDPVKDTDWNYHYLQVDQDLFPDLKWEDDPVELDSSGITASQLWQLLISNKCKPQYKENV